jgi:hypothetical protein
MTRVSGEQRVAEWRGRLERYRGAGLTVARFCSGEGVSVPSFYHWRRRLGEGAVTPSSGAGFVPVRVVGSASVAVFLPGGTRLEIPLADRRALVAALRAIARADAARAGVATC